jgi:hypothetical protein
VDKVRVRRRSYVYWLIPTRQQTSGTLGPCPRPTSACRSKPTICSALRRFFIREPFQAPVGAQGFSRRIWVSFFGGAVLRLGTVAIFAANLVLPSSQGSRYGYGKASAVFGLMLVMGPIATIGCAVTRIAAGQHR